MDADLPMDEAAMPMGEAARASSAQLVHQVLQLQQAAVAALQQHLQQQSQAAEAAAAAAQKEEGYGQVLRGPGIKSVPLRVGGTVFEVGISTLLHNTPPGSYFRALLRFHGVEDESSSTQALAEAIQQSGGALFIDEDPALFSTILSYLRNRSSAVLPGGVRALLLPESEPQRSLLRATAERLGLDELVGSITPPGDMLAHLHPRDAEQRTSEEGYRTAFISSRQAMVEAWRAGELLLDVHSHDTLPTFVYEEHPPEYPELFAHILHPSLRHPAGSRAVVGSLESFRASFRHITGGLFEGVDWSNMIVAGGAVLASLMRPPDNVEAADRTSQESMAAWHRWFGPKPGISYITRKMTDDGWAFSQSPTSGFEDSDIDVFFWGLSPAAANRKLQELLAQLNHNGVGPRYAGAKNSSTVVRSQHAVTLVTETCYDDKAFTLGRSGIKHVQVVLRLYSCPAEVLMGFDVDSCCVAYDGSRVYATPRGHRAITRRQNLADPGRLSPSYESRLAKYARRGFRVAVPGSPGRRGVDSSIYLRPWLELQGLAKLLRLEQRSIACGYQPGGTYRAARLAHNRNRSYLVIGDRSNAEAAMVADLQQEDVEADAAAAAAAAVQGVPNAHQPLQVAQEMEQARAAAAARSDADREELQNALRMRQYHGRPAVSGTMAALLEAAAQRRRTDTAASSAAAAVNPPEAPDQMSDYSSVWLPKDKEPEELLKLLWARSRVLRRAGAKVPYVFASYTALELPGLQRQQQQAQQRQPGAAPGGRRRRAAAARVAAADAGVDDVGGVLQGLQDMNSTLIGLMQDLAVGINQGPVTGLSHPAAPPVLASLHQAQQLLQQCAGGESAPAAAASRRSSAAGGLPVEEEDEEEQHRQLMMGMDDGPGISRIFDAEPLVGGYDEAGRRRDNFLSVTLRVEWMTHNPGRQGKLTGSFHPLEGQDWTAQAYGTAA